MTKNLHRILNALGILFVALSFIGFIPKAAVNYDLTSTIFIIGLIMLVLAFLMHPAGKLGGLSKKSKKTTKRKKK